MGGKILFCLLNWIFVFVCSCAYIFDFVFVFSSDYMQNHETTNKTFWECKTNIREALRVF